MEVQSSVFCVATKSGIFSFLLGKQQRAFGPCRFHLPAFWGDPEPKLFRASYYLLRVCHHIISGPRARTSGAGCSRNFLFKLLLERAA
jgi:hypothetical protein